MTDGKDKKTRRRNKSRRGRGKRNQQRSCGTKRKYESQEKALDAALSYQRRTTARMNAYRCSHCTVTTETGEVRAAWHIGHRAPRWRRNQG